jgi:hypothetical protein
MWRRNALCLLVLTCLSGIETFAQSGATGTIVGTVTDTSGAVVPNARVSITNVATNAKQNTVTSAAGAFSVPSLLPGSYQVEVASEGFSTQLVTGVELDVGKEVAINVRLNPGAVNQSVQVAAAAVALDTENAAVGQVINATQVVDLPLNGRNFTQLLLLGAGAVQNSGEQGVYRANEGNSLSIQGGRPDSNQYMLDGLTINDTYYQTPAVIPSIDAIQEFQEQTKGYSAAYGGGANQINLTTKSGTNQLHGTAYEFLRNSDLDARNFFDPHIISPLRQNQFGYSLGGPVWIPKLYNGKNRTFFFANYEGLRTHQSSNAFGLVPTTAELNGVFPGPILEPNSKTYFPNNTIPQSDFSAFGMAAISHFPAPNVNLPQGNYQYSVQSPNVADQQPFNGGAFAEGTAYLDEPTRQVAASYTHSFSPTIVNQLRFGWMHETVTLAGTAISESEWNAIGLQNTFPYNQYTTFPQIGWLNTGLSAAGGPGYSPQTYDQPTYQISDTLSMIKGAHNLSMGIDWMRLEGYVNTFSSPKFVFDGSLTGGTAPASYNPIADMLLGYAESANAQVPTPYGPTPATANSDDLFYMHIAPWIQDDWKVNKRLTINLGLRWDFMPLPRDARNNLFWLDPNIPGGGLYTASDAIIKAGLGDSLYAYGGSSPGPQQWGVFAPRVGVAFRPFSTSDKTVLRAGWGIFYDSSEAKESFAGGEYPFAEQSVSYNVYINTLYPKFPPLSPVTSADLGFVWDEAPYRAPYVEMWTASVEHEVGRGFKLEADYLGSEGHHLVGRVWENAPYPDDPANPTPVSARIPYPNLSAMLDHPFAFNSNYNALELKAEHSGRSLTLLASYTWSHSLDDKSSDAGINGDTSSNGVMDQYNWRLDYATSSFDVQQRFVGSFVYSLPFGKGRAFGGSANKLTDLLIGGWQTNGILTVQSGLPYSIAASDLGFVNQNYDQRANVAGNPYPSGFQQSINEYFNTAAFSQPGLGYFGDSGRNILRAPGLVNLDFSLFKNIPLGEHLHWQGRLESFNVLNHANFGTPNNNENSATFGSIGSAAPGRIVQVAMKLIW